jgi:hypothetical protein
LEALERHRAKRKERQQIKVVHVIVDERGQPTGEIVIHDPAPLVPNLDMPKRRERVRL